MEGNILLSDIELISLYNYDLNNIYEIIICERPINFEIKENKIVINKNLLQCYKYYNDKIIKIYDGLLNPIFNFIKPEFRSIIFIVDDDSFKLPIYSSNINNNFREIKSESGFIFKIEKVDEYLEYNYYSYLILDKSKTQPSTTTKILKEKINFILWNNEEYKFYPITYYNYNEEKYLNKFTLLKKEEYDSLSNGKTAYLIQNNLLIDTDREFFSSYYYSLKMLTPGIYDIYTNRDSFRQNSAFIYLSMDKDIIKGDFEFSFYNQDLDLTIKLNVINKTTECDYDILLDIINDKFTCNYSEYYDPEKIYAYEGIEFQKECNINYQFLYKDKGCIYNYKKYNLFIY
jgi:hypothetical protein